MPIITPTSPLRYPGGKQRLAPIIRDLLEANNMLGCAYAEPYAGGAGLALSLLKEGIVSRIILNDKCPLVATFWQVLFHNTNQLLEKIAKTPVTMETWEETRRITREPRNFTKEEVAFAFFFQNRTNFSGVIKGGVIGGKKQTGKYKLGARYPQDRLMSLINNLATLRDYVSIHNLDAMSFMCKYVLPLGNRCFTYCDPPYYKKGQSLYLNAYKPEDHAIIANFLTTHKNTMRWVVSYDYSPHIVELYHEEILCKLYLPYSANKVRRGKEMVILPGSLKFPSCLLNRITI